MWVQITKFIHMSVSCPDCALTECPSQYSLQYHLSSCWVWPITKDTQQKRCALRLEITGCCVQPGFWSADGLCDCVVDSICSILHCL